VFRLGRFFRVGHIIVCVFSKGKQTHAWAFITYEYARKFSNSNSKTFFSWRKQFSRNKSALLNQEEIEIYLVFFFSSARPVPLALLLFEHF